MEVFKTYEESVEKACAELRNNLNIEKKDIFINNLVEKNFKQLFDRNPEKSNIPEIIGLDLKTKICDIIVVCFNKGK